MKKNITFRLDEDEIRLARQRAHRENKSLNKVFNEWLEQYVGQKKSKKDR